MVKKAEKNAQTEPGGWRPVSFDLEAFRFATQDGFLSLEEVDEAEFEMPPGVPDFVHEGGSEQASEKKKKQKKKQKDITMEREGIAEEAAPPEAAAAAAAKKKKRKKSGDDLGEAGEAVVGADKTSAEAAVAAISTDEAVRASKKPKKKAGRASAPEAEAAATDGATSSGKELSAAADLFATVASELGVEEVRRRQPTKGATGAAEERAAVATAAQAVPAAAATQEPASSVEPVDTAAWGPFGLHDALLVRLGAAGFASPTPIQAECLPAAIHGRRDVVGAAETGSGKTLAFGLPIMQRLCELHAGGAAAERPLFALIIAPTRELAQQVSEASQSRRAGPRSHLRRTGRRRDGRIVGATAGAVAPCARAYPRPRACPRPHRWLNTFAWWRRRACAS